MANATTKPKPASQRSSRIPKAGPHSTGYRGSTGRFVNPGTPSLAHEVRNDKRAQTDEARAARLAPGSEFRTNHAIKALELVPVLYPTLTGLANEVAAKMILLVTDVELINNESPTDAAEHAMRLTLTGEQAGRDKAVDFGVKAARTVLRRAHNRLLQPADAPLVA
jgi:hypothetical protein